MQTNFNLPHAVLQNPRRVANYCAVEIVELFQEQSSEKEIAAVERRLKQLSFEQLGAKVASKISQLFRAAPTSKDVARVEAVINRFYLAKLNFNPMAKAA